MTREQIESDIATLEAVWKALAEHDISSVPGDEPAIYRVINRLRSDLAKLDGPAEGYERYWYVDDGSVVYRCSRDAARRRATYGPGGFAFFIDRPLPKPIVVEGTVIP